MNTYTVLHRFSLSHITTGDLVENNAVSLYSQLNGLLTMHGPHSVWYIHHKTAVLWLSAHLAGITQSGTIYSLQVQVDNKKASLNPETYLYYYNCYWYASCMHTASSILKI